MTSGASWAFRSRHDQAYLSAPPSGELPPAFTRFREVLEGAGGLWTDLTQGYDVIGPDAAATLSKLCSLDFHDDRFPNGTAARSGLAKVSALPMEPAPLELVREALETPPPEEPLRTGAEPAPAAVAPEDVRAVGETALEEGRVGVIMLAGGLSTRLGAGRRLDLGSVRLRAHEPGRR